MKLKKVLALALATAMTLSLVACGGSAETTESTETTETTEEATEETTEAEETTEEAEAPAEDGELSYGAITLGESYTDITTTIKWIHHKTDREEDGTIANYIAEFNKVYPQFKTPEVHSFNYTPEFYAYNHKESTEKLTEIVESFILFLESHREEITDKKIFNLL